MEVLRSLKKYLGKVEDVPWTLLVGILVQCRKTRCSHGKHPFMVFVELAIYGVPVTYSFLYEGLVEN